MTVRMERGRNRGPRRSKFRRSVLIRVLTSVAPFRLRLHGMQSCAESVAFTVSLLPRYLNFMCRYQGSN